VTPALLTGVACIKGRAGEDQKPEVRRETESNRGVSE